MMISLTREEAEDLLRANGWVPRETESSGSMYTKTELSVGIYLDWEAGLDHSKGVPPGQIRESIFLCQPETAVPLPYRFSLSESGLLRAISQASQYSEISRQ